MILNVLMVILVAGGLSAIIMLVQRRKYKDGWTGTVVAIQPYSTQDGDWNQQDYISVRYRRDDGQDGSIDVDVSSYGFWYSTLRVGDRLVKAPGAQMPQRVAAAGR